MGIFDDYSPLFLFVFFFLSLFVCPEPLGVWIKRMLRNGVSGNSVVGWWVVLVLVLYVEVDYVGGCVVC
jgi:hypothetical protein